MNIAATMATMFPGGHVIECGTRLGAALEIHGLPVHSVPVNCEVVAHGPSKFSLGHARRDIYLVRTEAFLILLRICAAGPDSADGEFAISRDYAALSDAESRVFQSVAQRRIETLCTVPDHQWPSMGLQPACLRTHTDWTARQPRCLV